MEPINRVFTDNFPDISSPWHTSVRPYLYHYYPVDNKGEKAIAILKHLVKKDLLKFDSAEDFVMVVEDIIAIL